MRLRMYVRAGMHVKGKTYRCCRIGRLVLLLSLCPSISILFLIAPYGNLNPPRHGCVQCQSKAGWTRRGVLSRRLNFALGPSEQRPTTSRTPISQFICSFKQFAGHVLSR